MSSVDLDDPNISYGFCYFDDRGLSAPDRYIPCGNVRVEHQTCCESGDKCVASNACYNDQYGVTYLAGCTDRDYESGACPSKGYLAHDFWAGLVYCNGTSNQWTLCQNDGQTVGKPNFCYCPEDNRQVAFNAPSRLSDIARLPASTGQSISWFSGHTPSSSSPSTSFSSTATTTSFSSTTSSASAATDSSTQTPASSSNGASNATASLTTEASVSPTAVPQSSGLSTTAKGGIGAGCGVAAFIIIVVLYVFWLPKLKSSKAAEAEDPPPLPNEAPPTEQEEQNPYSPGYKSELQGSEPMKSPTSPRSEALGSLKSEAEGSPGIGGMGRPMKDGGYEMPGRGGTVYEMP